MSNIRTSARVRVVATAAALCVLAAGSPAGQAWAASSSTPVLGRNFAKLYKDPSIKGFGHAHPREVAAGGGPGTDWRSIHWSRWGVPHVHGTGHTIGFAPSGHPYAKPVKIQIRATKIGKCAGQAGRAYTRMSTREQVRPGGRYGSWQPAGNICKGT